jgi:hypothetical protein
MSRSELPSINDFELSWRWTSSSHAQFAPDVLASIQPLPASRAAEVYALGSQLQGVPVAEHRTHVGFDLTRSWLTSLTTPRAVVRIAWSSTLAVELPWCVLVDHWDDFFYPASDDAVVDLTARQLLLWRHFEQFQLWARPI